MFSIYIHIPFCLKKCGYCDFYSVAMPPEEIPQKEYVAAVCKEAQFLADKYNLQGRQVGSIYFGGGTPTMFETWNLERILDALYKHFSMGSDVEITIEANPESFYHRTIAPSHYRTICNRLSIGVQTFNSNHLQQLGRIHSTETARLAVKSAQEAGFKNINIDIMWGLPGQTISELENDLDEALALDVQHISAYQLTLGEISRGGALSPPKIGGSPQRGSLTLPNEDIAREMWLLAHNKLTSAGYEHYEISNFSRVIARSPPKADDEAIPLTSFRCLHNLNYWHYGEWLGLGSGATSFLRQKNIVVPKNLVMPFCSYAVMQSDSKTAKQQNSRTFIRLTAMRDISQYLLHNFTYEIEDISQKTAMAEYCFMALRTAEGINLEDFARRFGKEFDSIYPNLCQEWVFRGLAILRSRHLAILPDGWLISDELFQEFV